MDERDWRILDLLQDDAWQSYVQLAGQVHLSASSVQRRVERMKRSGILLGAHARVSHAAHIVPLRLYALVELADDQECTVDDFRAQLASESGVIEAHYVTGESDVVLTLEMADMSAYDDFVKRNFSASPIVKRFKTLTSLRALTRRKPSRLNRTTP